MHRGIHRSEFVRQLKAEFPDALPYLEGMRDGITLEMSAFTSFTGEAIARGDFELVRRCFLFAGRLLEHGNRDVRAALAVCFLEDLRFSGANGEAAFALLSSPLREEWRAVHQYLHDLVGAPTQEVGGSS